MFIEKIPVSKINPDAYAWSPALKGRLGLKGLYGKKIKELGYIEPIVWNRQTGNLVGGYERFKILEQRGLKNVEAIVIDETRLREKALHKAFERVHKEFLSFSSYNLRGAFKNNGPEFKKGRFGKGR